MTAPTHSDIVKSLASLEAQIEDLKKHVDSLEKKVDELRGWANRWRGATAVLLGLGGLGGVVLGWLLSKN